MALKQRLDALDDRTVANPTYWAAAPRTLPLILQLDHDRKKVLVAGVVVIEARLDLETLTPLPFGPYFIHKLERIGYSWLIHSSMTLDFQLNGDGGNPAFSPLNVHLDCPSIPMFLRSDGGLIRGFSSVRLLLLLVVFLVDLLQSAVPTIVVGCWVHPLFKEVKFREQTHPSL